MTQVMRKSRPPMTEESLRAIGHALTNAGEIIFERLRHEGAGACFRNFEGHMNDEAARLRSEGQDQLAAAISKLAEEC